MDHAHACSTISSFRHKRTRNYGWLDERIEDAERFNSYFSFAYLQPIVEDRAINALT